MHGFKDILKNGPRDIDWLFDKLAETLFQPDDLYETENESESEPDELPSMKLNHMIDDYEELLRMKAN
jgi:hypothetical protein